VCESMVDGLVRQVVCDWEDLMRGRLPDWAHYRRSATAERPRRFRFPGHHRRASTFMVFGNDPCVNEGLVLRTGDARGLHTLRRLAMSARLR
jgi:hypothetical protein